MAEFLPEINGWACFGGWTQGGGLVMSPRLGFGETMPQMLAIHYKVFDYAFVYHF